MTVRVFAITARVLAMTVRVLAMTVRVFAMAESCLCEAVRPWQSMIERCACRGAIALLLRLTDVVNEIHQVLIAQIAVATESYFTGAAGGKASAAAVHLHR